MEAANSSETWESTDKNTRCRKPESQYLTHLSPDSTEAPFIWVQKVTYRHDKTVIQSIHNTRCRKPESQYLTHLSPDSTEAPFIWVQKVTYRHDKTVIQSTEGNLQTSQDSYPKYRR